MHTHNALFIVRSRAREMAERIKDSKARELEFGSPETMQKAGSHGTAYTLGTQEAELGDPLGKLD